MIAAPDRIEKLEAQNQVTGIDYIYVDEDQVSLSIYFLRSPASLVSPLFADLKAEQIHIYNREGSVAPIAITNLGWDPGNEVLELTAEHPGDFTLYQFLIDDSRIDPYYNDVSFSFKANCPSDLDCAPPPHECPPEDWLDFPVDYLARDFWSFRRALLDFAGVRYPDWKDRLAADAGVMLAELMSAQGDEMAYYQDRIAREAYLETATQRRSIRRHTRLVDYPIHDGLGATLWIDITVRDTLNGNIPAGTDVWATGENGVRADFEIGNGLGESLQGKNYFVNAAVNQFEVYRWDEDQTCLPVHSTRLYINGHHQADLQINQPAKKWVLLKTIPSNPAQKARNHPVRLVTVRDEMDPVINAPITLLEWEEEQATPFELDMTELLVRGNIIPATAGRTYSFFLIVGAAFTNLEAPQQVALQLLSTTTGRPIFQTIERTGPNESIAYLFTLPGTDSENLVWLGASTPAAIPELHIQAMEFNLPNWSAADVWNWKRSLIGVNSSQPLSEDYTLDDGNWRKLASYQRKWNETADGVISGDRIVHNDYAYSTGTSLRFGDGEFGVEPARKSVFLVHYRLGGGRIGNQAPDTINQFNFADPALALIQSVTNPLPADGGIDPETSDEIKQSAPQAFREITYRAVTPPDYAEAAERLPWVQIAGAALRWTGAWLTMFVTPDPHNAVALTDTWRNELEDQLNRFRQAGRETHVLDPHYANIDLDIEICVASSSFPGEVEQAVLEVLFGKGKIIKQPGFFSPERYTFGTPLERSQLEAVIQNVPGVKAVEWIKIRRRGEFDWKFFEDFYYDPGMDTIIRIQNDLLHPEWGILKLHTHGGL